MAIEKTLSIIKPDAVSKNIVGKIISRFEENGLHLVAGKLIQLDDEMASGFYAEHDGKPFFNDLKKFMTSGPVFVQVLEGENAIQKNRDLMGSTNPQEADPGTIRADFAKSIDADLIGMSTHGRKGLSHFFNGSISEDLVNHAKRPVITFKI